MRGRSDFTSLAGAKALANAMQGCDRGRVVVHTTELPSKCPVATLE